jgi:hypothetical protein
MSTVFIYAFYKKPLSMKKIIYLLIILAFLSCSKDEPIIESDTTNPNASITNVVVKDIDNDGQVDDAEISVTATDNIAINNIHVSVGGVSASKVGNVYVATNLSVGQHTAKVDVTDTSGNTASATRDFTVIMPNVAPTATITFNDFGEHTPIGTIVGTIDVVDANGDTITTTLEEGGSDFELVLQAGQTNKYDIKTKIAFDYEMSGDNTHNIKVKVADTTLFNEITSSASETDEDDSQKKKLCGGHGVNIIEEVDEADNNPTVENLKYYALDKDENRIGSLENITNEIVNSQWQYLPQYLKYLVEEIFSRDDILKDDNGQYQTVYATGTITGVQRLSDGKILTTTEIGDGLTWSKQHMLDAGYTYIDWQSWTGAHASSSNMDEYVWRLFGVYYLKNFIKSTDANVDNEKLLLDAFNKIKGTTGSEALAILISYRDNGVNGQTEGVDCN